MIQEIQKSILESCKKISFFFIVYYTPVQTHNPKPTPTPNVTNKQPDYLLQN